MKKCDLYEKVNAGKGADKIVRCLACKHYCAIPEGETGVCGVRINKGGQLNLLVHGHPAAVHVDPLEKKPLYHFLPGKQVFSIGTVGCNLSCKFCQNWELSQSTKFLKSAIKDPGKRRKALGKLCKGNLVYGRDGTSDEDPHLAFYDSGSLHKEELSPDEVISICKEGDVPAIAYTYNEPTIFFEYARDIGIKAREKGIRNIFVTSGYESPEALAGCEGWLDAMNIDLKSFSEDFYRDMCGIKMSGVLDTIEKVAASNIWLEITTLIIPGLNDSEDELRKLAGFIYALSPDIPWHVTAFYPCYKTMDHPKTPEETLMKAWDIGKEIGLNYVYTGNILSGHHDTECPHCGELVIERYGMGCKMCAIETDNESIGRCPSCDKEIPGIF